MAHTAPVDRAEAPHRCAETYPPAWQHCSIMRRSRATGVMGGRIVESLPSPLLDGRTRLPIDVAALDRLALVVVLLALGQAEGDLHAPLLEIHPNWDQRHPSFDGLADQFLNLVPMQEQLSPAQGF